MHSEIVSPPNANSNESTNGSDSDQDFEPTAEMMVDDYDDERTMAEEEALELDEDEDEEDELEALKNEQDMPIDKLKEMFGFESAAATGGVIPRPEIPTRDSSSDEETENDASKDDSTKDGDDSQNKDVKEPKDGTTTGKEKKEIVHKLLTRSSRTAQLLRNSGSRDSSDDEDDEDFNCEEQWRKTIQVGSSFQADIPESFFKYGDAAPYENEDIMQWEPGKIEDPSLLEYYEKWQSSLSNGVNGDAESLPMGSHVRDDERALWLLLQCGYNPEEALRRQKIGGPHGCTGTFINGDCEMTPWSEEECRNFEAGLRCHGKDFHAIKVAKVGTRSVRELVNFYYLWKKTERHDVFTSRSRLEKKKYSLHPGTTDYMDKFLDEQESVISRASSPNDSSRLSASAGNGSSVPTPGKTESSGNNSGNNNTISAPSPAIPSPQPIATQPV